jgi:hypothetical protein
MLGEEIEVGSHDESHTGDENISKATSPKESSK